MKPSNSNGEGCTPFEAICGPGPKVVTITVWLVSFSPKELHPSAHSGLAELVNPSTKTGSAPSIPTAYCGAVFDCEVDRNTALPVVKRVNNPKDTRNTRTTDR